MEKIASACLLRRTSAGLWLACLLIAGANGARAQKIHNTYGSPLDTIRNTHLTTATPTAKDFVRATSPDKAKLDYTPLTGIEPERPKPRDLKGVAALQAELESAGARNEVKAKGLLPRKVVTKAKQRPKAASAGGAQAAP